MKSIVQYINESKEIVVMRLENDLKDALQYFEENKLFEDKKLANNHKITKDDLTYIYNYATENHMPCPLVVNYGHKSGKFAFRRWVAQLQEELSNFDFHAVKSPYCGLHDTKLREDGAYFPSASDYEYVIAYGANKLNFPKLDDDENISIVFNKEKETNDRMSQIILFRDQNEKTVNNIVRNLSKISSPLYKLPNKDKVTKKWLEFGAYNKYNKKPNNTPKTDIISKDGKYKISLKKTNGSQLMSGYQCEARATVMSCINSINNNEDKQKLLNIFAEEWYKPQTGKTIKELTAAGDKNVINAKLNIKQYENIFREVIKNNPEFENALLKEAMTGNIKFGETNDATANCVFVWDENGSNSQLFNIDEYIKHIKSTGVIYSISFKTSGVNPSANVSLRIVTK